MARKPKKSVANSTMERDALSPKGFRSSIRVRLIFATGVVTALALLPSGCATTGSRSAQRTLTQRSLTQPPSLASSSSATPVESLPPAQPVQHAGFLLQEKQSGAAKEPEAGEQNSSSADASDSAFGAAPEILAPEIFNAEPVEIGQSVDLQSLIVQALASHPSIAAARQRVASITHRIPQVTALDDPMLNNTFWPIHDQALQTAGGRVGHQFGLSQKVPWPAKLDARGAVAQREVQVAQAEVTKAEREIVEAVRLAYYELWLADELIRIVEDNQELVYDLIKVSEARYRTGGSQQDVLRAESESDKLEEQHIALRRQKEQARADLGTLVGQPVHLMPTAYDDLNVTEIAPQLEVLIADAEQCNPTLQGLAAEIARDRARQTVACLQQYPDFQLGIGYSIINDDNNVISPVANGHDNINFTLGVTLPIWRDKINAGIREAAHQRNSTIHRREAERDRLRGQLRRQVAAAYAAIEQLELFRDRLIPRSEQTLEIAIVDYQGDKTGFTDLVDIYRELLSLEVQVARTKASLASTLAQIERTVGCPILD